PQMQPFGAAPKFFTATPLRLLGEGTAPVDCPVCRKRELTHVTLQVGSNTHLWAIGFCIFLGLGCIPYLMNDTKDVRHSCGSCGALLATWQRGGKITVVHAH
ncbi:LITAF-like zinc ribbon domain-containing protein, partial [Crucibulum laeve]